MNADLNNRGASSCVAERESCSAGPAGRGTATCPWEPPLRELERAVAEAGSDTALMLLWKAYRYAQDANRDVWDFALELDTLLQAGVTHTDLRWLVAKGFVKHACELAIEATGQRAFGPDGGLHFAAETCLVLTPAGAQHVRGVLEGILVSSPVLLSVAAEGIDEQGAAVEPSAGESAVTRPPCWNAGRRELVWGDRLVKRYRVPAPNQERILCAFEEEGWPERIDDPLPVRRNIDPRTRLHDAINRLNRHQHQPLLSFRGDGTGMGVFWEFRQSVEAYGSGLSVGVASSR